jgi:hypothetical protein
MNRKPSLLVVFLTVFIDLIGFGIVVLLVPIFSRHYDARNSKWCAKTRMPATIFRSIRFSWLACQSRQAVMAPGRYGSNEPGRQRSWYQPNSMATTANCS